MPSKLTKMLVENYAQANDYTDIEDMPEEDMVEYDQEDDIEDIDEEVDEEVIDGIIEELTNFYNNSDEEIQEQLDALLEEEDGIEAIVFLLFEEDDEEDDDDDDEGEEENLQELKVPSKWTKFKYKLAYGSTPKEAARRVASSTNANPGTDKSIKNASNETLHRLKGSSNEKPNHGSPRHMQIRAIDRELKRRSTNEEVEGVEEDYLGIAKPEVKTTKATAPSSTAPGATIDQPSKLGLKKLAGFIKAKAPSATNPGTAVDQPSKQGLEKPEVKTSKAKSH